MSTTLCSRRTRIPNRQTLRRLALDIQPPLPYPRPGLLFLRSKGSNALPGKTIRRSSGPRTSRLYASVAISNELPNAEREAGVGERSKDFRNETEKISSPVSVYPSFICRLLNPVAVDEGTGGFKRSFYLADGQQSLSVCGSTPPAHFRPVNRNCPRLADIRGATNALAIKTLEGAAIFERSMTPPA